MVAIIFFVLLALPPSFSNASDVEYHQYRGADIIIQYEAPLANAAAKIAEAYPRIKTQLEEQLALQMLFVPTVVLTHTKDEFRQLVRDDLTIAFAVPRENLIVMDYSKLDRTPYDLLDTFKHELSHLLIHQNIESPFIPKWLDEGVAQWVSGGVADIINPEKKDILKQAVLSDALIPLRDLSLHFPQQSRSLVLAYLQSKSFVEFVVNEFGSEKLVAVLESMQKGVQIEQAVYKHMAVDLALLETQWQQSLKKSYSWPIYIADHIIWIVLFAAAFATLIGYIKFRSRLKKYRDEEDTDDFAEEDSDEDRLT